MNTQQKDLDLYNAISTYMAPDGCTGAAPHLRTVAAVVRAVQAMVAVSNARPVAYADEPWRDRSASEHLRHAYDHTRTAMSALTHTDPRDVYRAWTSDLGQPEVAHALLRLAFALSVHGHAW